mmetsp:Transcript_36210/g.46672  ORF Transcript_36210/g.46672 Transcript_36210/m.46672 type:complete len:98 (-) Transcript_36210:134-427(-)
MDYILFLASDKLFARALTYVALSRCRSLQGLFIAGCMLHDRHFKWTGKDMDYINKEIKRLRKFQLSTLKKGMKAKNPDFDKTAPLVFPKNETQFDDE